MNNRFIEVVEGLNLAFPTTDISEKTGYTKGNISAFLNNKKKVSKPFLLKFCEVFKLDYDALFKEGLPQAPKIEDESDMAMIILVHAMKDELLELVADYKNKSLTVVKDDFTKRAKAKQKELLKRLASIS